MKHRRLALAVSRALAASAVLLVASPLYAQETPGPDTSTPDELGKVVVQGEIAYRNRADGTAADAGLRPGVLPALRAADRRRHAQARAVRRPSSSDVLECDGARLRGLDPGYTQILINGEKVPGAGDDRSFFVDRIPAELVERIEIVRSPSANRSGDAVAGALNIVLRDALRVRRRLRRASARCASTTARSSRPAGRRRSAARSGGPHAGRRQRAGPLQPEDRRSALRYDRSTTDGDFSRPRRPDRHPRRHRLFGQPVAGSTRAKAGALSPARPLRAHRPQRDRGLRSKLRTTSTARSADHLLIGQRPGRGHRPANTLTFGANYAFDMVGGRTDLDLSTTPRFEDSTVDHEEEATASTTTTPRRRVDELEGSCETLTDTAAITAKASTPLQAGARCAPRVPRQLEFGLDLLDKQRDACIADERSGQRRRGPDPGLPPADYEFDAQPRPHRGEPPRPVRDAAWQARARSNGKPACATRPPTPTSRPDDAAESTTTTRCCCRRRTCAGT